ncbi:SPFH domain-containing protein [Andreprevotia chitinilytica]|uniref:SPFH domain-containing protein n=1 Tax=Andreprevotia chitinilytica TaxID=396808 RepID=UPI00068F0920|nr:SPFH domain-containing protein [Andreprevotia chitinilytica]
MSSYAWAISAAVAVLVVVLIRISRAIVYVPNNRIGIREKLWSTAGSIQSGLIALKGEAGFQPEVLRGGFHFMVPFQFAIHFGDLVTIPQGRIGYVFARDGLVLGTSQTLGDNSRANQFEDVRAFLAAGGQKGPQRKVLREGVYAINLAQFVVITPDKIFAHGLGQHDNAVIQSMHELIASREGFTPVVINGSRDLMGVVTVHDGPSLPDGQIIAPTVGGTDVRAVLYHNNFQEPERFLAAGGYRGRQLQVLVEGTYYLNRLFATVEGVPKTVIEVGFVGVVVSYNGTPGQDVSGADYQHGELVATGQRGVWSEPLLPGKYAFNTYAGHIIKVPTTNFILKWEAATAGSQFDQNLKEVSLITKDAFEPNLPLSVVVHIDYKKAPMVVQRFGDIQKLVEQTLDPMVSAYFKNIAQTKTLIELLQHRSDIQTLAANEMKERFGLYNLELQEVLIGTPKSTAGDNEIENILTQLRLRQIALEQIDTYKRQQESAHTERELREAEAKAKQQTTLTQSSIAIEIAQNEGKAAAMKAEQKANEIRALAKGDADRVTIEAEAHARQINLLAEADANRVGKVGKATAEAAQLQVDAYGGPDYRLAQELGQAFAKAIQEAKLPIVPQVNVGGEANALGLLQALMGSSLRDALKGSVAAPELLTKGVETIS